MKRMVHPFTTAKCDMLSMVSLEITGLLIKNVSLYRIMSWLDPKFSSCFIQWMVQLFGLVVDRNVFIILPISAGY